MIDAPLSEIDMVWARHDTLALQVRVYRRTDLPGFLPPLITVHGGAWNHFDRTAGVLYQRALAAAGFLVLAIDFRQGPDFRHPCASADVTAAVRWLRVNAGWLGADTSRIGLLGSSSGGHLAMLAGVLPDAVQHRGTPIVVRPSVTDGDPQTAELPVIHDEINARVDYLVALWPVSDPYYRYRYAMRAGIERLTRAHERYFADEADMRAASVPRVVTAGEAQHLPPLLVIMPGEDGNVPMDMTFDLLKAWQGRGGYLEYVHFPGEPHGFGYQDSESTRQMLAVVQDYCRRMAVMREVGK